MKIEFVKETNHRGDVYYYTTVDGRYEKDTISLEYSQAYEIFIGMRKKQEPTIEILEHYIIKETDQRGNVYYYTSVDGQFENNSLSMDYSQAYEFFIGMKKRKEPIVEVLEHYIIEEPKQETNEPN